MTTLEETFYAQYTAFKSPYGKVNPVSLQLFFDTLLPLSPPASLRLSKSLRSLDRKKGHSGSLITSNGRLWGYSQKNPSDMDPSHAFVHIRRCVNILLKTAAIRKPVASFLHIDQDDSNASDSSSSYPDALFYITASHGQEARRPGWLDIAVPGVYAQEASLEDITDVCGDLRSISPYSPSIPSQNNDKIVRLMAKCIRRNPRRRFVYGFTLEDSRMRLWYCDRSQIVCSHSFNFISVSDAAHMSFPRTHESQDHQYLFRFVLSCLLAEQHELGFDPTMVALPPDSEGNLQYDITVHSGRNTVQVYRTLDVIFDAGSDRVLGRGTRVWKAVRVEGDNPVGEPVVLKESWVDAYRAREGDIDVRIRMAALKLTDDDRTRLNDVLLTILDHGDVRIGDKTDRTPLLEPSRKRKRKVSPNEGQAHYRAVYQEVCTSLRDETSLSAVFDALIVICGGKWRIQRISHCETQCSPSGLYSLHLCGWVHGDISANNILLYGSRAILSDLEYAKCRNETTEHDEIVSRFSLACVSFL